MSIGLQAYLQGYMHEKAAAPLKDQDVNITAPGVQRQQPVPPQQNLQAAKWDDVKDTRAWASAIPQPPHPEFNPIKMKNILPGGRASLGEVGPSGARAASPASLAAMDVTGPSIPWYDRHWTDASGVSKNKKNLALLERQGVPSRDDDIEGPPGPYGAYDREAYFPHINKLKGNVETAK